MEYTSYISIITRALVIASLMCMCAIYVTVIHLCMVPES